MRRVGVDIGGTFTDLVAEDDEGRVSVTKVLTTPRDHAEGVMSAVAKAAVDLERAELFLHGSTIAINTVVERKGAKTGLITTRGFRDIYEIGRSNRPDAYNLFFQRPVPLVPRSLRLEVTERMTARGEIHTPLDRREAAAVVEELKRAGVESIAVCLLHSYANPAHEEALGEIIASVHPNAYVTLSHRILREYREYERTSTAAVNAYVGPVVGRYLGSLGAQLGRRGFHGELLVMQSGGGVMSLETAIGTPVRMMESGPVAGVIGAARVAHALGHPRAIAFDMGGTTAKTSLTRDGSAEISSHYFIGGTQSGHPVMLPVVDIIEVGSGGGSIARLDAAGGLKVGPVSAGALPGPACYGRGGAQPTVTDANLILGRLGAESFLGGEMALDREAAAGAVLKHVAGPLDLDVAGASVAILRIANAHMALALRAVSVERGRDPRDFALVAFGGAGPLHGATLARELRIPTVIVPRLPGQFSAWGMLNCDLSHDYVQTLVRDFAQVDPEEIRSSLGALVHSGLDVVGREGGPNSPAAETDCRLDLRYRGQEYTVTVPLSGAGFTAAEKESVAARFHELHRSLYGHSAPEEPLELVAVRATVYRAVEKGRSSESGQISPSDRGRPARAYTRRPVYMGEDHGFMETPVYRRSELDSGTALEGPAIIEEAASTTVVLPQDRLQVAPTGELIMEIANEQS